MLRTLLSYNNNNNTVATLSYDIFLDGFIKCEFAVQCKIFMAEN